VLNYPCLRSIHNNSVKHTMAKCQLQSLPELSAGGIMAAICNIRYTTAKQIATQNAITTLTVVFSKQTNSPATTIYAARICTRRIWRGANITLTQLSGRKADFTFPTCMCRIRYAFRPSESGSPVESLEAGSKRTF